MSPFGSNEIRQSDPAKSDDKLSGGERKRLSKKEKQRIHEYLDLAYGHKCFRCGRTDRLERHHANGDHADDRLLNFRWLCKPCNLAVRYKPFLIATTRLDEKVRENVGVEVAGRSAEMDVNVELRPRFQAWCCLMIYRTKLTPRNAIYGGAQYLRQRWGHGASVTTRRWLNEMVNPLGPGPFQLAEDEQLGQYLQLREETPVELAKWQQLAEWK